jgi:Ca2+-binding RTX toxin-like protein
MFKKTLVFAGVILVWALTIVIINPLQNSAWGETINCNLPSSTIICVGTNGSDSIAGNGEPNHIVGCGGNDVIGGGGGNDRIIGDFATVMPSCPAGGTSGAERITGGTGDDRIWHGNTDPGPAQTGSDGNRDFIDCGPGNDEVFINFNKDHDVAVNCEQVHAG